MKILKVRNVKTPSRAIDGSVGIDFFVPEDYKGHVLNPGYDVLIPTGIKADVPTGFGLVVLNKSGIASKKKLIVGANLIDPGYQGEIHMHVFNIGSTPVRILPGMKLVQMCLIPVDTSEIVEVEDEKDIFPVKSERGDGGFGHTGI